MSPLDLHVLGTPPAFVLSQDQTLPFNPSHLSMFNSLESSLIMSRAVRENRDYDSAVRVRFLFLARFSLLYRFQGSLRSFRGFPQASLTNIPKPPPFVKLFLAVFFGEKTPIVRVFTGLPAISNMWCSRFGSCLYILWTFFCTKTRKKT